MKKIDLGQTISIAANLGVIAGIIFLAFELQQNNKLLRAQADQIYLQQRNDNRKQVTVDSQYAQFWAKVLKDEPLDDVETVRLTLHIESTILNWQWEFGQLTDGNLIDDREALISRFRAGVYDDEGAFGSHFSAVWSRFQSSLRSDFVQFMDTEVLTQ